MLAREGYAPDMGARPLRRQSRSSSRTRSAKRFCSDGSKPATRSLSNWTRTAKSCSARRPAPMAAPRKKKSRSSKTKVCALERSRLTLVIRLLFCRNLVRFLSVEQREDKR
ncbi:MAG: hypothetical protein ACR2HJ_06110 [Fimbriimonadales bacterium]